MALPLAFLRSTCARARELEGYAEILAGADVTTPYFIGVRNALDQLATRRAAHRSAPGGGGVLSDPKEGSGTTNSAPSIKLGIGRRSSPCVIGLC